MKFQSDFVATIPVNLELQSTPLSSCALTPMMLPLLETFFRTLAVEQLSVLLSQAHRYGGKHPCILYLGTGWG
jgi:hypothetical protein